MTKEEKKEANKKYCKKYLEANKEKVAAYKKVFYEANKERYKAYDKAKKDGLYTVYYLKEEHYAGMTTILQYRLKSHKHNGKHIEDVEVVGKYETKEEALMVEAKLHSMGYLGRNPIHKQQTLKELI
tara:strand:- start:63 stop:443 length:381 start_codon:yes stop_codon:yes gene_type:complete